MKLTTTIIALFLSVYTFSQLKFNPKIGGNVSNFTQHDETLKSTGKFGFGAGFDLRIGGRFYFAPGLYYLSTATEVKELEDFTVNDVIKFQTIELPLTLGFNILDQESFKLGLKAGIEGAYFANISEVSSTFKNLSKDDYNRLNWGFQFGLGVDVKKITFDIKYDLGKNVSFKDDLSNSINPKYNRMHLYVGYLF
ncbi:PorT family protein [Cyclobacteriaceae bacterium]|nr:PorT family protein [Cyclobacteriaceae bacterium]